MNKKIFITGIAIISLNAFGDYSMTDNSSRQRRQRSSGYWVNVPMTEVMRQGNVSNLIEGATDSEVVEFLNEELNMETENFFRSLASFGITNISDQDYSQGYDFSELSNIHATNLDELDDETLVVLSENDNLLATFDISDEKDESRVVKNSREDAAKFIR